MDQEESDYKQLSLTSSLLDEKPVTGGSATCILLLSSFVAVCGSYSFGCTLGYSSPAETGIMEDLSLSVDQFSVFGSIMSIGAMVGAGISGKISDLYGRRKAMGISEIICTVGWLIIAFAQSAWLLDLGRLFTGCGVGLLSFVIPVYISEITPKNLRGGFAALHMLVLSIGTAVTYFVGAVISWRNLALIGIVPCVAQLLGLFIIPESPRWLGKIGLHNESEAALRRLRGENANISDEAAEINESIKSIALLGEGRISDLFQWKYARSLTVGIGIMLVQQLSGNNAINFYAGSIFEEAGFSADIGAVVISVIKIPMTIFNVFLMDRIGRKPLLLVSVLGTTLGCFLVALSFSLQGIQEWKDNFTPLFVFIGITIYNASTGLGMSGIPWIIMSEIFPINMKGSAGSLVSLINWFSSFVVAYVFNFFMAWSSAGTFYIFFGICCLGVVFIAKLVPETKGKTLEEIQAVMTQPQTPGV
ncbi:Major facilitator superfamily protein [Euphorbia peplus]|nr:Major facilitator superfamily protein [Euphorbia peplus]